MLIVEQVKLTFRNIFLNVKRKEREYFYPNYNKSTKNNDGDESITSLLGEDKLYPFKINSNTKGILTNSLFTLSILPSLYLLISLLTILLLLILKYKDKSSTNNGRLNINENYMRIPNFYDLPKINPLIYHIYTCTTSLVGLTIVLILFSVMKQRFKVPEYREHAFKLYTMLIFGMISNFLNFAKGFAPYYKSFDAFIKEEINEFIKINLSHILFLSLIFFSILFSIYSIRVLVLLRNKEHMTTCQIQEENWYSYKLVILFYLSLMTIIYLIFLLHDNQFYLIRGSLQNYIEVNLEFVITMFPYFIHVINAVLMFSFYFELKYVNLALSQNLEVDYLFEEPEKNNN